LPENVDVVVGGFPCQDISINGKRKGIAGIEADFIGQWLKRLKRCKPKFFVAENVKGLLLPYNKESLEQILADFRELGYNVSHKLYLAADFGVPQMRERVLLSERRKIFRLSIRQNRSVKKKLGLHRKTL